MAAHRSHSHGGYSHRFPEEQSQPLNDQAVYWQVYRDRPIPMALEQPLKNQPLRNQPLARSP
ncbi:MAG: hypothetical protein AAGF75_10210, partial [Cyanobacteria bacterium P01_H01_bin.130]